MIILVALVMFSSFISSITSSMTHLRVLREAQQKQSENVRKYISDNKLSMDLSNRIQASDRAAAGALRRSSVGECRGGPWGGTEGFSTNAQVGCVADNEAGLRSGCR